MAVDAQSVVHCSLSILEISSKMDSGLMELSLKEILVSVCNTIFRESGILSYRISSFNNYIK